MSELRRVKMALVPTDGLFPLNPTVANIWSYFIYRSLCVDSVLFLVTEPFSKHMRHIMFYLEYFDMQTLRREPFPLGIVACRLGFCSWPWQACRVDGCLEQAMEAQALHRLRCPRGSAWSACRARLGSRTGISPDPLCPVCVSLGVSVV